jgi:hypothetical protein
MESGSVKSYIGFIGMLVSAKPEYVRGVLENIVRGFTYREFFFIQLVIMVLMRNRGRAEGTQRRPGGCHKKSRI